MPNFTEEDVERAAKAVSLARFPNDPRATTVDFRIARAALTAAIPEGMVLVSEKLVEAARGASAFYGDEACSCPLCELRRQIKMHDAAHSAAQEKKP